jgi:hypothetical protein
MCLPVSTDPANEQLSWHHPADQVPDAAFLVSTAHCILNL